MPEAASPNSQSRQTMQLSTTIGADGTIVLTLGGDIDVATSGDVLAAGLGVLGSRHCSTLCLDLAGVTFLARPIASA